MSLTEDPWRPGAGRDHILCGAFKKGPLGGTGHIRVLAHFPKGQEIIRCTEPNSTNPIHNYTHKSNKLCHITGKLNYYIESFDNFSEKRNENFEGAPWLKCFFWGQGRMAKNFIIIFLLASYSLLLRSKTDPSANMVSYSGRDLRFGFLAHNPASAMTLTDISISFLKTHLNLTFLRLFCFQTQNSIKNKHCWWHQEPELRTWRGP